MIRKTRNNKRVQQSEDLNSPKSDDEIKVLIESINQIATQLKTKSKNCSQFISFLSVVVAAVALYYTILSVVAAQKSVTIASDALADQRKKDSVQRIEDGKRNLEERERFAKQIELSQANQRLVESQNNLVNKQAFIAEKQYQLLKKEKDIQEEKAFESLKKALSSIVECSPWYGLDSTQLTKDFVDKSRRLELLNCIESLLKEQRENLILLHDLALLSSWRSMEKTIEMGILVQSKMECAETEVGDCLMKDFISTLNIHLINFFSTKKLLELRAKKRMIPYFYVK